MAKTSNDMTFIEHLEEFRKVLFRSALALLIGVILIVVFHDFVVNEVIMGPRHAHFITYRLLCSWSEILGLGNALCLDPPKLQLQSTTMSGNMNADLLVCFVGGIVVAFPMIFYNLWSFIRPGLRQKEIHAVRGIVFFVSLLFFLGAAFGYFILAPLSIQFLGNYEFADVQNNATILSYLKLTTSLVLGTGLIFQLPVLVFFLAKIGLITADFLRKYRKHAFVVNLIIAAIITPPDVTSQILVALPMLLLYELSIWIAARHQKK